MSQVNLLPREIRQKQAIRRNTALIALAGVVVLVAIGFFYFLQTLNLSKAQDDLAAQQATNSQLQGQINNLSEFGQLQQALQARQGLIQTVFANEIAWSGVLLDVSRIIPSQTYLATMSGSITVPTGTAPAAAAAAPGGLVGNISFDGFSVGTEPVADWLTKLEQVKGWVNSWATTVQEDTPGGGSYSFSSGVDLTSVALTKRGQAQ